MRSNVGSALRLFAQVPVNLRSVRHGLAVLMFATVMLLSSCPRQEDGGSKPVDAATEVEIDVADTGVWQPAGVQCCPLGVCPFGDFCLDEVCLPIPQTGGLR